MFAPPLRSFGRLGWPARLGGCRNRFQQIPQFGQAVRNIASLVSISLAGDDQIAIRRHTAVIFDQKPLSYRSRYVRRFLDRPAEHGFGVDFVDVLPARTGTSNKGELKLSQRNFQSLIDDEHDLKTILCVFLMCCGASCRRTLSQLPHMPASRLS